MSKFFSHPVKSTTYLLLAVMIAFFIRADSTRPAWTITPAIINQTIGIHQGYSKLPLSFELNAGQTGDDVKYISRGAGAMLYLTEEEAVLELRKSSQDGGASRLGLKLIEADRPAQIEGIEALPGKSNYFIGNDPKEWRTDIPNFSRVRYSGVYPGVDLIYYGNQRELEYDFVVAPGGDPSQITMAFDGADRVEIDQRGDLAISLGDGLVQIRKPVIYQQEGGRRREINGDFLIDENNHVGFQIGEYDHNKELVIDPVLSYATYFGGSGVDVGYDIDVDQNGNVYVTGQTWSPNYPTKNPYNGSMQGANDAFVMKLNAAGNAVVFSTYIGGRNPGDKGWAIAVDKAGNVYFAGETTSLNFPLVNPAQSSFRGTLDGFVAKLNIEGNTLLYSTYLGGFFVDAVYDVVLNPLDNLIVTGRTEASNFPIKNAIQPQLRGFRDAFVTMFNADGGIVFSTYLGGSPIGPGDRDDEAGYGIALDSLNNIYVTGVTSSPSFPVINALQPEFGGIEDAFVTKIDASGTSIVYSTYLGGSRVNSGGSIAVDSFGAAYVTGYTISAFPLVNPLQPEYGGSVDGFVSKISPAGDKLVYSTFLGGSGAENTEQITDDVPSCAILVDSLGNAYITGKTASADFPTVRAIQNTLSGDSDAYVAKIDPAGSALIFSTLMGGSFTGDNGLEDRGLGIAMDNAGAIYITGQVLKNDFMTASPVQASFGGGLSDAFIAKITTPDITGIAPVSAASFFGSTHAPDSIISIFGVELSPGTALATTVPLPESILGTTIKVKDSLGVERSAPLFFVSPGQVNFLIPPETALGKATVNVEKTPGDQSPGQSAVILIDKVAPAFFTANSNGQGVPAAVLLRVLGDGTQIYEPVAILDDLGRFTPLPIDLGPETDQVFLIAFGAGWRHRSDLSNVRARIGGVEAPVLFAGAQGGFVGQDQLNLRIPRSLAGRGEVSLTLTVDGMIANIVTINVQ